MRKLLMLAIFSFLPLSVVENGERIHINTSFCEPKVTPDFTPLGVVDVTMYHPVEAQTNANPDIVADGTRFDINIATELNWIALSRDLHQRWGGPLAFNDVVFLKIPGEEGRFFKVKDIMNRRFTMRVDILETPGTPIYAFPRGYLYKVDHDLYDRELLWAFYESKMLSI